MHKKLGRRYWSVAAPGFRPRSFAHGAVISSDIVIILKIMPLSGRTVTALVVFLVLWVIWCFFAVDTLVPIVVRHYTFWHWLVAWILCLLPLVIVATAVVFGIKKKKV